MKKNETVGVPGELKLEVLEQRLAPAPVWGGGEFPGKGKGLDTAKENANDNAAFDKFTPPDPQPEPTPQPEPESGYCGYAC